MSDYLRLNRQIRDVDGLEKLLKTKPESYWIKRSENMALKLFHNMASRVPAYKDFLKKNSVNAQGIRNIKDFKQLPLIDKDNYLRRYPREALCWDGKFSSERWVVSTTSGSTGEPFYFPRTDLQDEQYALTAELYLRENFQIQNKKTLYIDAFAMGAWIGGLYTYEAIHRIAQKGYALSIICPGINKAEVINSVRQLGPEFDQVIIGCYPPIMRDIIDHGIEEGIDWRKYNLGIVFSAEGFGEEFRDHITQNAKLANIYTSTLNHYGTVDLGTMSHETPVSILVRRQAVADKQLFRHIFGNTLKQPTLTQFHPEMFYFEAINEQVICSGFSGLPLVRYDLKDHGGVITFQAIEQAFTLSGKDLQTEIKTAGLTKTVWNLPFVYVYERSDFSVNLLGGVIYPEEIRKALLKVPLPQKTTGKFTMEVANDRRLMNKLIVHVELKRGCIGDHNLSRQIQKSVVDLLLLENSEYANNYASYGKKIWPTIKLWPFADELYFNGRGKQKWVKK
ncbi:MAG: phenylacetate--CoA ligase family protein [Candidatus Saccharimonadales bacterium]